MAAAPLLALDAEACRVLTARGFSLAEVRAYLDRRLQADLRDQFAIAAMNQVLATAEAMNIGDADKAAEVAYKIADAMLRERAK